MERSIPLYKLIFAFFMLLIVVFSIYRIFLNASTTGELIPNSLIDSAVSARQPDVAERNEATPAARSEAIETLSITNADAQDNIVWHADRGYYSFDEQAVYKNYDLAVLKGLAGDGDTRALNELANRSIEIGNFASAEEYFWDAAARGDSAVLLNLARLKQTSRSLEEQPMEREANDRGSALDGLALIELASLRGDVGLASVGRKIISNTYQFATGESLELSVMENELIALRAEELYQDLLKKRHALGLGDFDDSSSKVVKEIFLKR